MAEDASAFDYEYECLDEAIAELCSAINDLNCANDEYAKKQTDYSDEIGMIEEVISVLKARQDVLDEITPPKTIWPADAGRYD